MGVAAFTGLGGSFPVVWVADFTGIRKLASRRFLGISSTGLIYEK